MTVVRRQRSDNFAIIPNAVAEDERLSLAARGLLCYLLAKPHDWTVAIPDIMKSGKVGRDKAYGLLKELRQTGYVSVHTARDKTGRIVEHNYVVYDCAIPDRLPLPEKTERVAPRPRKPDVAKPLPEKPVTGLAVSGKPARLNKNSNINKRFKSFSDFDRLLDKITAGPRDAEIALAKNMFDNLPAPVDRDNAIAQWPLYETIQTRRGVRRPGLLTYLKDRAWRELIDAPEIDDAGHFIITPDREEWAAWLDTVQATTGAVGAITAKRQGRMTHADRWPPAAALQLAMAMPLGEGS